MKNKNRYLNKNVWIIGASFGIGQELFYKLNSVGANLIISARSEEKLQEVIKQNSDSHQYDSLPTAIALDIVDQKSIELAVKEIQKKWQQIDLIIFCAGIYEPMNVDNFDLAKSQNILEINFSGFVNLLDKILPLIKQNKVGHLAIISSAASYFGMHNSLVYGASKAALSNLAESLYLELKKYQTKVSLINPGFVKTRLTSKNNFEMPFIIEPSKAAEIIIRELSGNKFEIFFPKVFIWIMKIIKLMPYKIELAILSKVKK